MNNLDDEIYVKLEYSRQENQSRNFRLDVELHLPGKGITAVFGESGPLFSYAFALFWQSGYPFPPHSTMF